MEHRVNNVAQSRHDATTALELARANGLEGAQRPKIKLLLPGKGSGADGRLSLLRVKG